MADSTDATRIEDSWSRPSWVGDQSDPTDSEFDSWISDLRSTYDSGKPLYPRTLLLELSRVLELGAELRTCLLWNRKTNEYSFQPDDGE
jgi:hypothetical protein